jgi:hypothetical protein
MLRIRKTLVVKKGVGKEVIRIIGLTGTKICN